MKRLLAATLAIPVVACGQSGAIDPGMWSTEVTLSAGRTELWSSKADRCMDPAANNEDPIIGILRLTALGPCRPEGSRYGGGHVALDANCLGRPDPALGGMPSSRIELRGRYSANSIDANFTAMPDDQGQKEKLAGRLIARRTGDC